MYRKRSKSIDHIYNAVPLIASLLQEYLEESNSGIFVVSIQLWFLISYFISPSLMSIAYYTLYPVWRGYLVFAVTFYTISVIDLITCPRHLQVVKQNDKMND